MFLRCTKCKKKLIKRLPNGLLRFEFGSSPNGKRPVFMEIYGSVRMRCLRKDCGHFNTYTFFPPTPVNEEKE